MGKRKLQDLKGRGQVAVRQGQVIVCQALSHVHFWAVKVVVPSDSPKGGWPEV